MRIKLAALGLLSLCSSPAWAKAPSDSKEASSKAEPTASKNQLLWSARAVLRAEPMGLLLNAAIGYKRKLFNRDGLLFRDSHFALQGTLAASPTFSFVGARVVFEPLAVLRLWAGYEVGGHFGVINSLRGLNRSELKLPAQAQFDFIDNAPKRSTMQHRMTLAGRLQAKYKRFAARYEAAGQRYQLFDPQGKVAWFNATLDILVPTRGWSLRQDADLLFELKPNLFLATRYTQITAYHEDLNRPIAIRRLGPAVVWRRPAKKSARVDANTWFAMVQWHLSHPFRNGKVKSPAVPMVLLGWAIQGR